MIFNNNNNNKLHLYRAFSKGYKAQKKNITTTKKKNSETEWKTTNQTDES